MTQASVLGAPITKSPRQAGEVAGAIQFLRSRVAALHDEIANLTADLEPALMPLAPEATEKVPELPHPATELASAVHDEALRVDAAIIALGSLRYRLAL